MTTAPRFTRRSGPYMTSDAAVGTLGFCLAVASGCFGVYMTVHGPSSSLGSGHDFSVFAQLAPRTAPGSAPKSAPMTASNAGSESAKAVKSADDLDLTATATIPSRRGPRAIDADTVVARGEGGADSVIESMTLEAADSRAAMITVGGALRTVRVGDTIPGAGDVLAIVPGRNPVVRTSRGLILASRRE